MASQQGEDWAQFDQSIRDVVGSENRGSKRSRDEVESSSSLEKSAEEEAEQNNLLESRASAKRRKNTDEEVKEDSKKVELAKELLFTCAACGLEAEEYKEVENHVQDDHKLGDDQEMVVASILLPSTLEGLKIFQCGVTTCGKKFVGLKEVDLKRHIAAVHGEYYISVCEGRNVIRLCAEFILLIFQISYFSSILTL